MAGTETISFESKAKLMISGEYAVLKGALSLSVPLRFGQKLQIIEKDGSPSMIWSSLINDTLWLRTTLLLPDFQILETNHKDLSETLRRILIAAKALNPKFLERPNKYEVTSEMDFNPDWGIGSGSSLISNIAYWAECDPFVLNRQIFNGSGYDIACSRSSVPIIYGISNNQPEYREAAFHPTFSNQLYFIYLNRKQNSKQSISKLDLSEISQKDLQTISDLTLTLEKATDLTTFQSMMNRHENVISAIIHESPVKIRLFDDFEGSVKSLGAWGGDFVLAASSAPETEVFNYFINKNLTTIFRYAEMDYTASP